MKKYKVTLSSMDCANIEHFIEKMFEGPFGNSLSEAISMAAFHEVLIIVKRKRIEFKREYKFSFTAVQALSFCFLYNHVCNEGFSNSFSNRLLQINNEVHQHYSL